MLVTNHVTNIEHGCLRVSRGTVVRYSSVQRGMSFVDGVREYKYNLALRKSDVDANTSLDHVQWGK